MPLEIIEARTEDRDLLMALLEKYLYEFSQWDLSDVDEKGMYGYKYLDYYWTEENRFPYLVRVDGKPAGFVLISNHPDVPEEGCDFSFSEFFIMHKYRRHGYGKRVALDVLGRHHGRWQLKYHPHNLASAAFWESVVSECTGGNYRLVEAYPNREIDYDDGTPAGVFFFEN